MVSNICGCLWIYICTWMSFTSVINQFEKKKSSRSIWHRLCRTILGQLCVKSSQCTPEVSIVNFGIRTSRTRACSKFHVHGWFIYIYSLDNISINVFKIPCLSWKGTIRFNVKWNPMILAEMNLSIVWTLVFSSAYVLKSLSIPIVATRYLI